MFSAVIGDVMDKMGLQHQFLPPAIVPLERSMTVCGRALTVLEADISDGVAEGFRDEVSARPFGLMLDALDDLRINEVYICTGGSPSYALWGEMMSVRAMKCGAAGAIVDGYSRDTFGIINLGFPTCSLSMAATLSDQAPRGKVVDFQNSNSGWPRARLAGRHCVRRCGRSLHCPQGSRAGSSGPRV